ncbi:MAG: type II CAAX endopeptidase family protein [Acidobacteriota bacterium]
MTEFTELAPPTEPRIHSPRDVPGIPRVLVPPPSPAQYSFGPMKAMLIFGLYVLAQFAGGFLVLVGISIREVLRGGNPVGAAFADTIMREATAPLLVISLLLSAVVVFIATLLLAWPLFAEHGFGGLGWNASSGSWRGFAIATGLTLALVWILITREFPLAPGSALGPLAKMAAQAGLQRGAWALVAFFFAPITEEFLFRGVLFAGFARRLGIVAAAVIVTALFVALHLFETLAYLPAAIAVTTMATIAILLRIRSGSLLPSILVHATYNLTVVAGVYLSH